MKINVQINITDSAIPATAGELNALHDALRASIKPVLNKFAADRGRASAPQECSSQRAGDGNQDSRYVLPEMVSAEALHAAVTAAYAQGSVDAIASICGGAVKSQEDMMQAVEKIVNIAIK
jgi:hypothetical protein